MIATAPVVIKTGGANTVTLVIAVVGLALAIASIVWQIASFRLGGPRLKAQLRLGFMGPAGIVSGPPTHHHQSALMAAQGYTQPLLGVEVTNRGRMPISIDDAKAKTEQGTAFHRPGWNINPESGYRLEPASSKTWWVDMHSIEAMVKAGAVLPNGNRPQKVRMVVHPQAGKPVETKAFIIVVP